MKIVCVYHSIDLDGWMSAAIVKLAHIGDRVKELYHTYIDFIGYNYGQPIPDLSEYDKVIMCDISFPKEDMLNLWATKGLNFIWIDHHISAIKDMENAHENISSGAYPIQGLRDTNYAACELTWMYFFPNEPMPEIVRLLGRYDCFGHKGTSEELKVLEFQYGARQVISNYEEAYEWLVKCTKDTKGVFPNTELHHQIIWVNGKTIYAYLCTEAKQTYKNRFEMELGVKVVDSNETSPVSHKNKYYKFVAINKERFNPINFGIDYHKDGYDGCACFYYANGMWNFSLYNDNGLVDCSLIAKQYGGGGHKGAAGFKINNINEIIKYE